MNKQFTIKGLPNDLMTSEIVNDRRLKVETITRTESKIGDGGLFVGATKRENVPSNDTYSTVFAAGSGGAVIEDVLVTVNFGNLSDGHVNVSVIAFVESSNGNSWTYTTGGAVIPAGRSVNTEFINTLPLSTMDQGVAVNTLTGIGDYPLYFVDYLIDTSANRNTLSSDRSEFFSESRKIVVGPNERVLVQTKVVGTATGTVDFSTIFFISEPLG